MSLRKSYEEKRKLIEDRLKDFKEKSEEEQYKEFLFCILTPQSNAQRCWEAIESLFKIKNPTEKQIHKILSTKTRFHNTKTKRIIKAKESWKEVKPLLKEKNKLEVRNKISKLVNGYGLKESGHFLRNIGQSNNEITILDRHILRNLHNLKVIDSPKIKSPKHYLEIEQKFLEFSEKVKIPVDHLDLLWWSQENGEIFK